jgi:flagellar motor switch/type III secretory pathway protein FliN
VNVTPFRLIKNRTLEQLSAQAHIVLARWSKNWGSSANYKVLCEPAAQTYTHLIGSAHWHERQLLAGASFWTNSNGAMLDAIGSALFPQKDSHVFNNENLSSDIASSVVCDAYEDLIATLIYDVTGESPNPRLATDATCVPKQLFQNGAGSVLFTLNFAKNTMYLLVPHQVLRLEFLSDLDRPSQQYAGTSSLQVALSNTPVKLSVEVGYAELSVGDMETLTIGDVIALTAPVTNEMRVIGPNKTLVCHAQLGVQDGQIVIEVTT